MLDRLDKYVEDELIPVHTSGKRRKANPPYIALTLAASKARKQGDLDTARRLSHEAQAIPSRKPRIIRPSSPLVHKVCQMTFCSD